MDFHSLISRYTLLPIGKTYSGRKYFKAIKYQRFLEKTQYWDRGAIEDLRNRQFSNLISHCYENVTFYRKYMDKNGLKVNDFQTIYDITKLPIITKETLKNNKEALKAINIDEKQISFQNTGGTTSTPAVFGRDLNNEYRVDANNCRFGKYAGYVPGMKSLLLWAHPMDLNSSESLHMRLKLLMDNAKIFNSWDLTEKNLLKLTNYIAKSNSEVIRGYASAIYNYIQYCKAKKIIFPKHIKSVIITADKIYEEQKGEISQFFECEVFEEYGCREFSVMAHECEKHKGLHLAEEHFIFEVLNQGDRRSNFEGTGELVVTPLYNYAMPLLRYSLGDDVTISSAFCDCGKRLRLITDLKGRVIDYVVTKNNRLMHGSFFFELFGFSKGISRFQAHQHEKGKVLIKIVKNKDFSEKEIEKIMDYFRIQNGDDIIAEIRYVDDIEISPSGKRRICISEVVSDYLSSSITSSV
jgi:phenylacetate-CoA ligase